MSKLRNLLNKISKFEKKSIMNDKEFFLKSLAQDKSKFVSDQTMSAAINSLSLAIDKWVSENGNKEPTYFKDAINSIKNHKNISKFYIENLAQLKKDSAILSAIAGALKWDDINDDLAKKWILNVMPLAANVSKLAKSQEDYLNSFPQVEEVVEKSNDVAQPTNKKPEALPTIDKSLQEKLNTILVPTGKINPLKIDGILGPSTQKALDEFRAVNNVPGNYSLQETLEVLKKK